MTLTFPNPSRSYDAERRRIRFVGHDGMFQIEFQLDLGALVPSGAAEAESLAAFDRAREAIRNVAGRAYSKSRQKVNILTAADFS